jgi:hypothetical protein
MAYTINLTNGTTFATITDGTVNTASSMTLIGKNYAGYGQFLDDNFIHLLENSANSTAPAAPLTGQLWWDSTNTLLKVYAGGVAGWKGLGGATASSSQPSPSIIGDLWYDTVNQQLKVCSVAGAPGTFIVVGPAYSSAQGVSGAVPVTISDGSTGYIVTGLYANNNLVGIISGATDFVPAGNSSGYAAEFPKIYKGFTVWNSGNASGNVSNPGNITLAVAGSVIETVASTGVFVTGIISASGNVIGSNVFTTGQVSATGNIIGANFIGNVIPPAGGAVSTTGNITGGNILTSGLVSATGNATGGNLRTAGLITATGNITGGNILTSGLASVTGNIQGGNLRTAGLISATGNITGGNILYGSGIVSGTGNISGGYIFGNGSQLTGVSAAVSVTKFQNGTSEGNAGSSGGNINFNVGGTSNVMVLATTGAIVTGLSTPSIEHTGSNAVGNIGSSSNYFNRLFVTGISYGSGTVSGTGNITGGNILTGGLVSATGNIIGANFIGNVIPPAGGAVSTTGNITGGNILTSGLVSATGNIIGANFIGNVIPPAGGAVSTTGNITGGNILTSGLVSATGNIIGNVLSISSIEHTGSNAVGNIGSSSNYFNRLFATATTALYADVAERFAADEELAPGTVVELGGTAEITRSQQDLSENVFGVISTRAAYLMNGGAGEDHTHPPVAMTGRVPVQVIGVVRKGDRLVSAGSGVARAAQPGEATAFNVIGRALVDKPTAESGTIEAIVTIK